MQLSQTHAPESAHDILRRTSHPLDMFFKPQSVAVIGATEKQGSVGRMLLWNLLSSTFGGTIYPINPKRPSVLGIKTYASVAEVPDTLDLAVIITPAQTVPQLVKECVDAGVKACIIISAGFKEIGAEGAELERQIMAEASRTHMRIIGPNCMGVMSPITGINASFASQMARPGNVAFLSQSGALGSAILDWSLQESVGFSVFMSLGSMLDVGWGDLIDYLGNDPRTKSIVIYMESIGDARSFLSAAREVALTKPIIVIKAGRTAAAAKAAASHTGALTGSDDVLDAAFRRSGVLRVNAISDLFYMAEALGKQPHPRGPRLTILTNAGGPAVLATDALINDGGELADVSPEIMAELDAFLPGHWSHANPVDVLGDAAPDRYARALEITARDKASDGLLVVLTPQSMSDPTATAESLKPLAKLPGKPVLASWMGGVDVAAGRAILNHAGIPSFPYPDTAARVFNYMWKYSYNLKGLYETPSIPADSADFTPNREFVSDILATARKERRTLLTEVESKELLAAYGIPVARTVPAATVELAVQAAEQIGYPVVLKLLSKTITHKTDVGGVKLNLCDEGAVRSAYQEILESVTAKVGAAHFEGVSVQPMVSAEGYEIILGSTLDAQFGPVLLFGSGGQLVEVYQDRALALPPLNSTLASRMMEETKIFKALKGVRGRKACDVAKLEQILVRFSQLVVEQPWIKEIDINPLMASAERLIALDGRVVLHDADVRLEDLPRPAIRSYPVNYMGTWTTNNGHLVSIRPIRPEDEPLMVDFHESLSEQSVRLRYFHTMHLSQRVSHERLTRICFTDYDRELALVTELKKPDGELAIVAVGRLSKSRFVNEAEFAIVVSDPYQKLGIGTELLRRLIDIGRQEGLRSIYADIMNDNVDMKTIASRLGFTLKPVEHDNITRASMDL